MRNEGRASEKVIIHGVWTKDKQVYSFHAGEKKDIKFQDDRKSLNVSHKRLIQCLSKF